VAENGTSDLVGTYEAHLILGVERSRLARWLSENEQGKAKVPEPVARLKSGPVWKRSQIEQKLAELAAEAGVDPNGPAFDAWAAERSLSRARQMKPPMPDEELERIIRRPLPTPA
jgi:hypothetical protein